jgi:hypothetical protein
MKDPRELRKFILDKVMLADLLAADGIRLPQRIKPQQLSCPFHGKDLSMSARFYPETNSMYCFACKEAWDPISYVMKSDGIKFMPAANFLVSHYKLDVSRLRDLAFGDHTKFKGGAARKSKLTDDEKRKKAFIMLHEGVLICRDLEDPAMYAKMVYVLACAKHITDPNKFSEVVYPLAQRISSSLT